MTLRRLISLTLLAACLCCAHGAARGQSAEELRRLLALPAPTPRASGPAQEAEKEPPRQDSFTSEDAPPPDDARAKDLLDYWERRGGFARQDGPQPSGVVRERLLAACEAEPEKLAALLRYLPETEGTAERVKRMYDAAQNGPQLTEHWHKTVRDWLRLNSKYFLEDLLALARKVKDKDGYIHNEEELRALARVDWTSAEPLLQDLSNGDEPRASALALALLYSHGDGDADAASAGTFRARLRIIASDRSAPARARDLAIRALSLTDWPGRDEWYLSLLEDETLLEPSDGYFAFSPRSTLFNSDPDKWIPVMTKLVESKSRAVQQAAASCLVLYVIEHPRRDAILPVLRWLTDPAWIEISDTVYAWFMQKMGEVDVPESVPGLIWIVENDEDNRHWAARTLAHYKDARAVPALKKALAEEKDEDHMQYFIEGLLASGGLSEAEQLAALEVYAEKISTSEGREDARYYRSGGDHPRTMPFILGRRLASQKEVPDSLVAEVLARVESLQKKNPAVARALLEVAERWQTRRAELDILRRIAEGRADSATIAVALARREKLRDGVGPQLRLLAADGGAAQGVAAVLLEDEGLAQNVLGGEDLRAKTVLLACARLVQMPLPVAHVGALLGAEDELLALAAERYLLAEDSREARALLWGWHKDRAFITGWCEEIPLMVNYDVEAMSKGEEELRAELLKEGGPAEIFALLANSDRPVHVLRVYPDRAVYTDYEGDARSRERVVTNEELAQFKRFVTSNNLEELGPQISYCHYNCSVTEFLSLRRAGGRRVFSHQPVFTGLTVFLNFLELGRGPGVKIRYSLEEQIKGLEVLHADESLSALDVWQRGAETRVLFERDSTAEELEQEQQDSLAAAADEEDAEAARSEARLRAEARSKARVSWRVFSGGRPGAVAPRPEGYSTFDEEVYELGEGQFTRLNGQAARAVAGDSLILAGSLTTGGLWKKAPGRAAVRISGEGNYADPVVTPDGKWVVAARTDAQRGDANYVVRLNLRTGAEYRVGVDPADKFDVVAYLEAHGRVLLRSARDENSKGGKPTGPDAPEYYLLDAATGRVQKVAGVFEPLLQEGRRFLQPAGKGAEYWAAIPDSSKNQTRVGRYNLNDFSFQPLLVVPHLLFNSMAMWVEEDGAKFYVVYEGQLLRLPMKSGGR